MPVIWIVVVGLVGLALGGAVGFLACDRRGKADAAEAARQRGELDARLAAVTKDVDERRVEMQRARVALDALQDRVGKAEVSAGAAAERADGLRGELAERDGRIRETQGRLNVALDDVAGLKVEAQKLASELDGERANVAEQKRLLGEAEKKFTDVFAGVGGKALENNTKSFLELAGQRFDVLTEKADGDLGKRQEQIEKLVAPMTVLLKKYEERLKEVEDKRVNDKEQLSNVLAALQQSHARLDTQTGQLATALSKGNTRGRWGEIALERIVELAGMTKNVDFETQKSVDGETGGKLRPDMTVLLPDDRRIVLDSKVPWDRFYEGCAEKDEARRADLFRAYAKSVRGHATALSARGYQDQVKGTLEFVVMFLPGEAFLYAAVEHDPKLIEDAMKSKVVIATPTTLIALLKAVEFGWRQHDATANAAEIQKLGEKLHKNIGVFVGHFAKLGKSVNAAAEHYNAAMSSLERNLLTATQQLDDHGIKSGKQIDAPDGIDLRLATLGDKASAAVGRAAAEPELDTDFADSDD